MIKHNILFIGLDTHKTFTEVAFIEDQRGAKSIHLGEVLSNKAVQALRGLRLLVTAITRQIIAYIWPHSREVVLPVLDVKLRLTRMPA